MDPIKFQAEEFCNTTPDWLMSKHNIAIVPNDNECMMDWSGDGSRKRHWEIKMYVRASPYASIYLLSAEKVFTNMKGTIAKPFDSYAEALFFLKNAEAIPVKCFREQTVEIE